MCDNRRHLQSKTFRVPLAMAAFKTLLILAVAVACVMADEPKLHREKKDVLVGTYPYALPYTYHYGYDDGKYYPGKYEKPTLYSAAAVAPAVAPAVAYSAYPYAYNYGAYPYSGYHYGAYPYKYYY